MNAQHRHNPTSYEYSKLYPSSYRAKHEQPMQRSAPRRSIEHKIRERLSNISNPITITSLNERRKQELRARSVARGGASSIPHSPNRNSSVAICESHNILPIKSKRSISAMNSGRKEMSLYNISVTKPSTRLIEAHNALFTDHKTSHHSNANISKKYYTPNQKLSVMSSPPKGPHSCLEKLSILWNKIKCMNETKMDRVLEFISSLERMQIQNYSDIALFDLKILSNWGDPHFVGLTEIQIYDKEGKRLDVNASSIIVKNSEKTRFIESIVNGITKTVDPKNMTLFSTAFKSPVIISIPIKQIEIGEIKIWNYNSDLSKCAKDIEIFMDSKMIWKGTLAQSNKSTENEYCTNILMSNLTIDLLDRKIKENKSDGKIIQAPIMPTDSKPGKLFKRKSKRCFNLSPPPLPVPSQNNENLTVKTSLQLEDLPGMRELDQLLQEKIPNSDSIIDSYDNTPFGRHMTIYAYSTWGDKDIIGLMGLEFWNSSGDKIKINEKSISAEPPDLNVLTNLFNTSKDQRVISNLVKYENCFTCDQSHCWMAPFTNSRPNKIMVDFESSINLGMIRIWNYNKSRIYTNRGIKDIKIEFGNGVIFEGEIKSARGNLKSVEKCFEVIMFVERKDIIEHIALYDWASQIKSEDLEGSSFTSFYRPSTANNQQEEGISARNALEFEKLSMPIDSKFTGYRKNIKQKQEIINANVIEYEIIENWGCLLYTSPSPRDS